MTCTYQDESKNETKIYQDNTNLPVWKQNETNNKQEELKFTRKVRLYQVELKFTSIIWAYQYESKNETKIHHYNMNSPGWKQKWDQNLPL